MPGGNWINFKCSLFLALSTPCTPTRPLPSCFPRHSANINLHRKLLTKELDDMGLDSSQPSLSKDLDEFDEDLWCPAPPGAWHQGRRLPLPLGRKTSHLNGYGGAWRRTTWSDLSTTSSSLQSSSSIHSSRESSDAGSDEGILLDDIDGAQWQRESAHKAEAPPSWRLGPTFVVSDVQQLVRGALVGSCVTFATRCTATRDAEGALQNRASARCTSAKSSVAIWCFPLC